MTSLPTPGVLAQAQPLRILFVDDEEFEVRLFERRLKLSLRLPYELSYCASVECATDRLRRNAPDLLLLDNMIPPYRGYAETLPLIRDCGYRGPVVLISGNITPEAIAGPLRDDLAGVLDKNCIDRNTLSRVLRETGLAAGRIASDAGVESAS